MRQIQVRPARPTASALLAAAGSRRWIALGIVALLVALGCVFMGRWQWERTLDLAAAERAASLVPEQIEQVTVVGDGLPNDQVGRRVILNGEYLPTYQQLVRPRLLGDAVGVWVLTPLRLPDGSLQAVLRGWAPDSATAEIIADQTPLEQVRVTGALQPYETFYADADPPPGTLVAINAELIAQRWPDRLRPGVVVLQGQQPVNTATAPTPVPVTQGMQVSLPLQNAFYALQWFVFAMFALALWVVWVWREAVERSTNATASVQP